jgi:hypothetical protein
MFCCVAQVSPSRLAATEDEDLPTGSQLAGAASGGSATAAEAAAKARGKLVSALMKRHLVEQVGALVPLDFLHRYHAIVSAPQVRSTPCACALRFPSTFTLAPGPADGAPAKATDAQAICTVCI